MENFETINFEKNAILGDVYNPLVLTDLSMPLKYELKAPYPNPFNPTTSIEFSLIENQTNFSLNIYDIRGRLILNKSVTSQNVTTINVASLGSALYLVTITTDRGSITNRLIVK